MGQLLLGAFSVSLSVKDIQASRSFYDRLGFTVLGGNMEQNWLIMKNGLFQGMLAGNLLTFNPGWDQNAQNTEPFDDVRLIQQQLKQQGIILTGEADEKSSGPAHITLTDPDGNQLLVDQHRYKT